MTRSDLQWLFHVTLNTGEVRKCFRREVSDEAVKAGDAMLSAVLQSDAHDALEEAERNEVREGYASIPWMDGYYLTGTKTRRNAMLTVWRGNPSGVLRDRVVTMAIGTHSRGGTSLFRLLLRDTAAANQIDTRVSRCPPEPWVAERLEPGSALCTREVLMMLSDLQRTLGWAWIQRLEKRRKTEAVPNK